jgi:chromosome segregation ATPase
MKAVERIVLVAALANCILLWVLFQRRQMETERLSDEVKGLRQAKHELDARVKAAESERDTLRAAHQALAESESGQPARAPRAETTPSDVAGRLDLIRVLGENQQKLSAGQATIDELNNRIAGMESRIGQLTEESAALRRSEADLKDRLDTQTRAVGALQTEAKARDERLVEVEAANRILRQRGEESPARLAPMLEAAAEIEELSRRREATLNNILRRYREVTDLYRNMTLEQPQETGISRIQNAITLAEEDIRQLQTLNAQSSRLQKKLNAARQDALKAASLLPSKQK